MTTVEEIVRKSFEMRCKYYSIIEEFNIAKADIASIQIKIDRNRMMIAKGAIPDLMPDMDEMSDELHLAMWSYSEKRLEIENMMATIRVLRNQLDELTSVPEYRDAMHAVSSLCNILRSDDDEKGTLSEAVRAICGKQSWCFTCTMNHQRAKFPSTDCDHMFEVI
jgi:hypothetical protein